ncbi:acyltransferase [Tenacibaculum sp. A30]|uniref:acyltransferase n=1 Tax=Tenacibaculum sp. A30 TaxID=3442644 RepID=UPI003EC0902E
MIDIVYNIRRGYRFILSLMYNLILFKGKSKRLYVGLNVFFIGKVKLGKNIRIYDNSKVKGNVTIGDGTVLCENTEVRTTFSEIVIGRNCSVNRNSMILGKVVIGNNTLIAPNVVIVGSNHIFNNPNELIKNQGVVSKGINISDDVWIGANVTITDGVSIGKGCVVGAGSVVTNDIPDYSIAVGVPAKIVKKRGNEFKE